VRARLGEDRHVHGILQNHSAFAPNLDAASRSCRWQASAQIGTTFLHNHAAGHLAMGFLVVPTINFRLLPVVILRQCGRG
jgi:hypothetical protein